MTTKKVRFNKVNRVEIVPNIIDLAIVLADHQDEEDVASCLWFNHVDYERFRKSDKVILSKLNNGEKIPEELSRGLESRTILASLERRNLMLDGHWGVLNEQKRQRLAGVSNPEMLRRVYILSTGGFVHDALIRGANDAKVARQIAENKRSTNDYYNEGGNPEELVGSLSLHRPENNRLRRMAESSSSTKRSKNAVLVTTKSTPSRRMPKFMALVSRRISLPNVLDR